MLAILNLGPYEIFVIVVVAILVFGRNLPTVAVQAASTMQKMKRSLADLRRETGIDEEFRRARRELEEAVPREVRSMDMPRIVQREIEKAVEQSEASDQVDEPPPGEDTPKDDSATD